MGFPFLDSLEEETSFLVNSISYSSYFLSNLW